MKRIIWVAVLALAGCATNRGATLKATYRAADPALSAPVGVPVLNGRILAWNQSLDAVQRELPGVALTRSGDWLVGTMPVDGHPATVGFGFRQGRLSRVVITFLGEGHSVHQTYSELQGVLLTELGTPARQIDARADAVAKAEQALALRLLADMSAEFAAASRGRTCQVEAAQADTWAIGDAIEAARVNTPEYWETRWDGPAGRVALLGNPSSRTPLQMLYVASTEEPRG